MNNPGDFIAGAFTLILAAVGIIGLFWLATILPNVLTALGFLGLVLWYFREEVITIGNHVRKKVRGWIDASIGGDVP